MRAARIAVTDMAIIMPHHQHRCHASLTFLPACCCCLHTCEMGEKRVTRDQLDHKRWRMRTRTGARHCVPRMGKREEEEREGGGSCETQSFGTLALPPLSNDSTQETGARPPGTSAAVQELKSGERGRGRSPRAHVRPWGLPLYSSQGPMNASATSSTEHACGAGAAVVAEGRLEPGDMRTGRCWYDWKAADAAALAHCTSDRFEI